MPRKAHTLRHLRNHCSHSLLDDPVVKADVDALVEARNFQELWRPPCRAGSDGGPGHLGELGDSFFRGAAEDIDPVAADALGLRMFLQCILMARRPTFQWWNIFQYKVYTNSISWTLSH